MSCSLVDLGEAAHLGDGLGAGEDLGDVPALAGGFRPEAVGVGAGDGAQAAAAIGLQEGVRDVAEAGDGDAEVLRRAAARPRLRARQLVAVATTLRSDGIVADLRRKGGYAAPTVPDRSLTGRIPGTFSGRTVVALC